MLDFAGLDPLAPAFLGSPLLAGAGYSLMFSGGLGLVAPSAPAHHRAAVISSAYMIGYPVQAVAALGLGALATSAGLQTALEVGAPLILLLGVAAVVVANARPAPVPA